MKKIKQYRWWFLFVLIVILFFVKKEQWFHQEKDVSESTVKNEK